MEGYIITIIVPVYNSANSLCRCIESILCQTYERLQVILVDDGSVDDSGQICDRFAKTDSRVEVIHQENQGPSVARRVGISKAIGDYIGFVDSDDYIEPEFYEYLLAQIIEKKADFVHSGYIEEYGNECFIMKPYDDLVLAQVDRIKYLMSYILVADSSEMFITPSIWSKLFKASFLKACYAYVPDHISYGEDLICLCSCIWESKCFAVVPYAGYHYVVREDSLSHGSGIEYFVQESMLYTSLCELFQGYGILGEMGQCLKSMLRMRMIICMNRINTAGLPVPRYLYPDMDMLDGKKILLYGAGVVGKSYFSQFMACSGCQVVAWVDKKHEDGMDALRKSPASIAGMEYDIVVIAIQKRAMAEEIMQNLIDIGITEDKIVWKEPLLNV